jgi:glycosyltransferase involved in cell wall biosynthesis
MRCPTVTELPPPPPGRTGWPWTEESPQLPDTMPDGRPWPRVSIVTPSYNSGDFLENAIRSVLLQGYPCIEHIIVDGGSTDGTLDVLRRYDRWVRWLSEKDNGQADALNKGFRMAGGEVVAWLNADDMYLPGAIRMAVSYLCTHPEVDLVHGDLECIDAEGRVIAYWQGQEFSFPEAVLSTQIYQTTAFFRRTLLEQVGPVRADLHYVLDWEFFLRLGQAAQSYKLDATLSRFRLSPDTKSVKYPERFWLEHLRVYDELFAQPHLLPELMAIRDRAYRRMHWLSCLSLYRSGLVAEGRKHACRALSEYCLLSDDADFAVTMCTFIEQEEWRPPVASDWIEKLLADLPPDLLRANRFVQRARSQFYATRFFYQHRRGEYAAARQSAFYALRFDPHWLLNGGFLSRLLDILVGKQAANRMRSVFRPILHLLRGP